MRLRLRFLLTLLLALFRPRLGVTESSSLYLRVLPNDIDLLHVTNDRYLAYMDLGRNDLSVRLGVLAAVRKMGAYPVVRTVSIRYRRAARLFQQIELRTQVICWDEEAAWFRQEMFVSGRSIALAYCKAEMRTKAGVIPIQKLLELAGHEGAKSPERPEVIQVLQAADAQLRREQQEETAVLPV